MSLGVLHSTQWTRYDHRFPAVSTSRSVGTFNHGIITFRFCPAKHCHISRSIPVRFRRIFHVISIRPAIFLRARRWLPLSHNVSLRSFSVSRRMSCYPCAIPRVRAASSRGLGTKLFLFSCTIRAGSAFLRNHAQPQKFLRPIGVNLTPF